MTTIKQQLEKEDLGRELLGKVAIILQTSGQASAAAEKLKQAAKLLNGDSLQEIASKLRRERESRPRSASAPIAWAITHCAAAAPAKLGITPAPARNMLATLAASAGLGDSHRTQGRVHGRQVCCCCCRLLCAMLLSNRRPAVAEKHRAEQATAAAAHLPAMDPALGPVAVAQAGTGCEGRQHVSRRCRRNSKLCGSCCRAVGDGPCDWSRRGPGPALSLSTELACNLLKAVAVEKLRGLFQLLGSSTGLP